MIETPFRLTDSELLCSAASTLCLNALTKSGLNSHALSEVIEEPRYGHTASATTIPTAIRFLRITDIKAGSVDWPSVPFCECATPEPLLLKGGDLLVARSGSVGKSFLVSEVPEPAVFASYMIRIRARHGMLPAFMFWCFQSQQFWEQLLRQRRGSAMSNINSQMLADLKFPIPDERLQADVAAFLNRFRQRLHGLPTSIGKLTPPLQLIPALLTRIEKLASQVHEARALRRQAAEDAEALIHATVTEIDRNCRSTHSLITLEDLARREKGSLRSGPFGSALLHHEFVSDGVPAIGIQDVKENRFELSRKWNVTPDKADELKRYTIKPRDILVTVMGTLGRACVVPDDVPRMVSTKHVWTITLDQERVEPRWVSFWINYSRLVREELLGQGTGTAIPGLNGEKLRSLSLPDLQLPEQLHILAYLDGIQLQLNNLRRLQADTATELDALLPAILDRAFKGEL